MKSQEMKTKEIKNILVTFRNYLASKSSILKVERGADPFNENCYTSSSSINGIYFPNTTFILNDNFADNNFYKFICIGKNWRDEEGFFLQLKDSSVNLDEYIFKPFHPLDNEYFKIRERIEEEIKNVENSLIMLSSFKQVYKKDGTIFKDYKRNFIYKTSSGEERNPNFEVNHSFSGFIYSLTIYFDDYEFTYYLNDTEIEKKYIYMESILTFERCIDLVKEEKERREAYLQKLKGVLKNIEKLYLQAKEAKEEFKKKADALNKESNYYLYDYLRRGL